MPQNGDQDRVRGQTEDLGSRMKRSVMTPRPGMAMPNLTRRLRELAQMPAERVFAALGYTLKRPVFALPLYRLSLPGLTATSLAVTPTDPWPGRAEAGQAILQGSFSFAGQTLSNPAPLWAPPGASAAWLSDLHGFGWLRDLRATGGDAARRRARELVGAWLEAHPTWSMPAWAPQACGQRLANWLGCFEFFAASAEIEFRHRLLISIAQQAQHLSRALPAGLGGSDLIAASKGLIYAGVALSGGDAWRARGLELLTRELPRQVLADGGHVERNPSRHMAVLRDLIDARAVLARAGGKDDGQDGADEHAIGDLTIAIEAMARILRMYQHGDGGLALFNGAAEESGWQVDLVLQRAGGPRRPVGEASHSGYQRMSAGRTLVLVDAGAPPARGLDRDAHAGALSLEVSTGRQRLIVNCGARADDATWHQAQRATAAHSTLVLGDTNSTEVKAGGLGRPARIVHSQRDEDEGRILLDLAHDGYLRNFGVLHRRRLYLSADGTDLRGEDRLEPRPHRAPKTGPFAVRFHLHPTVSASLAQGGDSVLLRPPKGGGWHLHAAGAVVSLEPSIYLGLSDEIRRSQQVVLSAMLGPDGARVKWALRRADAKRG